MKIKSFLSGPKVPAILLSLALGSLISPASAKISLPSVITDNMVLQQQTDAPLWGKANPGKKVTITTSWDKQTYTVQAAVDGKWTVRVKTPVGSNTAYTITISDGKALTLNNVLIGEVWLCSGQSNMEMPLAGWGKIANYQQEIAQANYPTIRLLHVAKNASNLPLENAVLANGGWKECSPATISEFSSVGYFFGRELNRKLNVPVGLINSTWGGTIAEAWTSDESIEKMPDFKSAAQYIKSMDDNAQEVDFKKQFAEWDVRTKAIDKGYSDGKPQWAMTGFDDSGWKTMQVPGFWEGLGLNDFDGIAWFRKEVSIPAEMAGKELKLSLGGIDDNEETYFNGVKVGATDGWDTKRNYTVPASLVKVGKAVITVKVTDTGGNGGFHAEVADMNLSISATQKIALAGEWHYAIGAALSQLPVMPRSAKGNPNRPTVLYNAMINPLVPYAIKGAIWYQGESNENRAYQYRELLPLMITDWRNKWHYDFPFYLVQLANFRAVTADPVESKWAELREAQFKTLCLANTGLATAIDIGDAGDIHPKNKQEVGRRLSLAALAKTYGQKVVYSGPLYRGYRVEGSRVRIFFGHTEEGLKTQDGQALKGFAVAGPDHTFHWASAVIDGNEVVVNCSEVDFPVSVRYAWADNPVCNLVNGAGLPALPFRTDDWPGITFGQK